MSDKPKGPMFLFHVERPPNDRASWDDVIEMVVAAQDEATARHAYGRWSKRNNYWKHGSPDAWGGDTSWPAPDVLVVRLIGTAAPGIKRGIIVQIVLRG